MRPTDRHRDAIGGIDSFCDAKPNQERGFRRAVGESEKADRRLYWSRPHGRETRGLAGGAGEPVRARHQHVMASSAVAALKCRPAVNRVAQMLLGGRFILVGGSKCFLDDQPLISHHAKIGAHSLVGS
jgi:hypothetical protein